MRKFLRFGSAARCDRFACPPLQPTIHEHSGVESSFVLSWQVTCVLGELNKCVTLAQGTPPMKMRALDEPKLFPICAVQSRLSNSAVQQPNQRDCVAASARAVDHGSRRDRRGRVAAEDLRDRWRRIAEIGHSSAASTDTRVTLRNDGCRANLST